MCGVFYFECCFMVYFVVVNGDNQVIGFYVEMDVEFVFLVGEVVYVVLDGVFQVRLYDYGWQYDFVYVYVWSNFYGIIEIDKLGLFEFEVCVDDFEFFVKCDEFVL